MYENGSRNKNRYEPKNGQSSFKKMLDNQFDRFSTPTGSLTYACGETMTPDMKGDFTEVVRRIREAQENENPNLTTTFTYF